MITNPLHVATVGRKQLRFFRTPNDDGRPDFPWLALDDLQQCLGLNRRGRMGVAQAFVGAPICPSDGEPLQPVS
jgi:hypothetical protein